MGNERVPGPEGLECSSDRLDDLAEGTYDPDAGLCVARPTVMGDAVPRGAGSGPGDGPGLFAVSGEVHLPSPLTPEGLARAYLSLPVTYRDPETGVRRQVQAGARIYTNIAITARTPNLVEKDALVGAVRTQGRRGLAERLRVVEPPPESHRLAVAHTFFGKGLPSEVVLTLSYALTLGRCRPDSLAAYCDDLRIAGIGLDCSGFVNAFFMLTRANWRERYLASFRNTATQRRTSASVVAEDVLVWESADSAASAHIAIVSRGAGAEGQFIVVESTGSMGGPNAEGRAGGLSVSTYTIPDAAANGVFTVRRGNGTTSTVKIFGVPRTS